MAASDVELLSRAWEAFARGDLNRATEALDPVVRWYGAEDPDAETRTNGGRVRLAAFRRRRFSSMTLDERDRRGSPRSQSTKVGGLVRLRELPRHRAPTHDPRETRFPLVLAGSRARRGRPILCAARTRPSTRDNTATAVGIRGAERRRTRERADNACSLRRRGYAASGADASALARCSAR